MILAANQQRDNLVLLKSMRLAVYQARERCAYHEVTFVRLSQQTKKVNILAGGLSFTVERRTYGALKGTLADALMFRGLFSGIVAGRATDTNGYAFERNLYPLRL